MSKKNERAGVILLEVELLKALSHQKKVAVEVAWPDMTSLPLSGDTVWLDQAKVDVGQGPADDDTILDKPLELGDFTWQASYDSPEWIEAKTFAAMANRDPHVISARIMR